MISGAGAGKPPEKPLTQTMGSLPYPPRPGQEELIGAIDSAMRERRCAVIEAGTGMGKTVSSLCGVLPTARERGLKVIYLTRTKSQQKQVVREAAAIDQGLLCVAVQGRSASSCPMMRNDPDLASGTSEEISKLCSEYKRRDQGGCHCKFYERIESEDIDSWVDIIRGQHPDSEAFARMAEDAGLCPYELVKYALPHADIVAVPYPFVFMPQVLDRFIEWIGVPISRTMMVVDEAHNLPDYLREVCTYECSMAALDLADKEVRDNGDHEVHEGLTVADIVAVMKEVLGSAVHEYLIDEDGMLPPYYLEEELMSRLGTTSVALSRICRAMEEIGDGIAERKRQMRKLPRTYIGSLSRFIQAWISGDEDLYVRLVVGGGNPKFQSYCMDPSEAADPMNLCHSSVHMSGTLEPLESYIAELGLERTITVRMGSVFPKENLLTLYSNDVSMRYEDRDNEQNYNRLTSLLLDTVNSVNVNTAVFFPSYQFMDRVLGDGFADRLGREAYYERRDMQQGDLMEVFDTFRTSEGSVLLCVTGGRISEGLDFPDKALELAVVVGIPYPKPTAKLRALTRYYDIRFGDGRRHVSLIPATRKVRQAIGRLIRSETDRGVAVVLDRRVAGMADIDAEPSDDIPSAVRGFLSGR